MSAPAVGASSIAQEREPGAGGTRRDGEATEMGAHHLDQLLRRGLLEPLQEVGDLGVAFAVVPAGRDHGGTCVLERRVVTLQVSAQPAQVALGL